MSKEFKIEDNIEDTENEQEIKNEFIPLFEGIHNPNHDIFVIPTQAGADDEDQWNGSIGDATMEHVTTMSHRLMEMEHYVHMNNGNLFRVENNVAPPDEEGSRSIKSDIDKLNLSDVRAHDLSKIVYTDGFRSWNASYSTYETSALAPIRTSTLDDKKNVLEFLKEEITQAKLAREERNDIMEQTRIPFSDWEFNPQMANIIDMPSTPSALYIYAGNSKDMFYDHMPEDHPDKLAITKLLTSANSIEWDNFDEKVASYFNKRIDDTEWSHLYAADRLKQMFNQIATTEVNPSTAAKSALDDIDNDWGSLVRDVAITKFNLNPVVQEMVEFEKKLAVNYISGRVVWSDIGKFGQYLFKKYGTEMTTAHWNYYKQIKLRFAPTVFVSGININTAHMNELRNLFKTRFKSQFEAVEFMEDTKSLRVLDSLNKTVESLAAKIYFARPFFSVEDLAAKKLITVEDLGYNNNTVVFISSIKKAYTESLRSKNIAALSRIAQQIINIQQNNSKKLSDQEWLNVWQVYRVCKGNLISELGITVTS